MVSSQSCKRGNREVQRLAEGTQQRAPEASVPRFAASVTCRSSEQGVCRASRGTFAAPLHAPLSPSYAGSHPPIARGPVGFSPESTLVISCWGTPEMVALGPSWPSLPGEPTETERRDPSTPAGPRIEPGLKEATPGFSFPRDSDFFCLNKQVRAAFVSLVTKTLEQYKCPQPRATCRYVRHPFEHPQLCEPRVITPIS